MRRVLLVLFITYVFVVIGHGQNSISVSQESTPGAGDFSSNLLGNITIFDQSTLTVEEIYQLGTTVPGSYNGTLTPSLSNTTQIFFVQTLDGLALFVLHDHPDSDGGSAQMSFTVLGDPDGVDRVLEDDLSDTIRPGSTDGPFSIQSFHWWIAGRSDGVVLCSLEDQWSVEAAFSDVNGSPGDEFAGITEWVATSADGGSLPVALELDRRIRLEPTNEVDEVPDVTIELWPGNAQRPLNCNHLRRVIVVFVPTTPEFNATAIDHTTVSFSGAVETHTDRRTGTPRRHEKDFDRDGDIDLLFHFRLGETDLTCDSEEAALTGHLGDGSEFSATARIYVTEGPRIIKVR